MSMPEFPKCGCCITREQALNMILASIAAEELSLSQIMEAESEKIKYVVNRWCDCEEPCSDEILKVNQSVTNLLDVIMQNQVILKDKMNSVLKECPKTCRKKKKPEIICNCGSYLLEGAFQRHCWKKGTCLPWRFCSGTGNSLDWNARNAALIYVNPAHRYQICMEIELQADCGEKELTLCVVTRQGRELKSLFPLHYGCLSCASSDKCAKGCQFISLRTEFDLPGCSAWEGVSNFAIQLSSRNEIWLEQAILRILDVS